jgi:2-polyprenyl-3-methyl-5-hydroxy-6-metoxy-1,4-benzoquinol methylase
MSTRDPIHKFFETSSYLERNAIIPVRSRVTTLWLSHICDGWILDLGCGDGSVSRPLLAKGNRLTLVDFSSHMIAAARSATPSGSPVTFVQADILEWVPDRQYDAVLCVGVLAHVSSVEAVITKVVQSLRPGGLCVLQITDDGSPLGSLLNRYYRFREHAGYQLSMVSAAALLKIAARHNLRPLHSRRYGIQIPGLGLIPAGWEAKAEMNVASRPRLARLGAELLVCFRRSSP